MIQRRPLLAWDTILISTAITGFVVAALAVIVLFSHSDHQVQLEKHQAWMQEEFVTFKVSKTVLEEVEMGKKKVRQLEQQQVQLREDQEKLARRYQQLLLEPEHGHEAQFVGSDGLGKEVARMDTELTQAGKRWGTEATVSGLGMKTEGLMPLVTGQNKLHEESDGFDVVQQASRDVETLDAESEHPNRIQAERLDQGVDTNVFVGHTRHLLVAAEGQIAENNEVDTEAQPEELLAAVNDQADTLVQAKGAFVISGQVEHRTEDAALPAQTSGTHATLEKLSQLRTRVTKIWSEMLDEEETKSQAETARSETIETEAFEKARAHPEATAESESHEMFDFDLEFDAVDTDPVKEAGQNKKLNLHLLVDHVNASWPVLEHVAGRDVVVLLGNTGGGKSLLIQAVAGRQVRRKLQCTNGRSTQDEQGCVSVSVQQGEVALERWVWDVEDPVEGFAVGHDQVSKTKRVRHYTPEPGAESVVYVDAPGYEDTSGVEVDIATSMVFRKVASQCSRLRFAVLVDCYAFKVDRGGVMRSVARLVSSYVRNFMEHKTAFTFLFTKTDALGETSDTDEARRLLLDYLNETIKGSVDTDVKMVLKWMLHCLKKRLPFAEVYHPALSNIRQLRDSVEMFSWSRGNSTISTAITDPRKTMRVGMTSKAEAQLKLDLRELLEQFRAALGSARDAKAERLFSTLHFLHTHVATGILSDIHAAAMRSWGEYATKVAASTYALIDKGVVRIGNSPVRVGRFSANDGREAMRGIARLQLLERAEAPGLQSNATENALEYLDKAVKTMTQLACYGLNATSNVVPQLGSTQAHLQAAIRSRALALLAVELLCTWAEADSAFAADAQHAEASLLSGYRQALAAATYVVESREAPHVDQVVLAFMQLAQTKATTAGVGNMDAADADGVLDKCKQLIRQAMSHITLEASRALATDGDAEEGGIGLVSEPDLTGYWSALSSMEDLCSLLEYARLNGGALVEESEAARSSRTEILTEAKLHLVQLQDQVVVVVASFNVDAAGTALPRLERLVAAIAKMSTSLSAAHHVECGTSGLYATAVSKAGDAIRQLRERANARCMQALQDRRLVEPRVHAAALKLLAGSAWLDAHLQACASAPFVEIAMSRLQQQYQDLCAEWKAVAVEALRKCIGSGDKVQPTHSSSETDAKRFQDAASAIEQLGTLAVEVPEIAVHIKGFAENARASVELWRQKIDVLILGDLTYSASPRRDERAEWMDTVLRVCDGIELVSMVAPLARQIRTPLMVQLSTLNTSIRALFQVEGSSDALEQKSAALAALLSWRELGFSRVTAHLPSAEELRAQVGGQLQAAAAVARAAVEGASGDSADAEAAVRTLTDLAQAFKELDSGQSAGHIARDLKNVLELRVSQLDHRLQESLQQGRFRYVRDYIQPLLVAIPNDVLKRDKVDAIVTAAKDKLREKFEVANTNVANASIVAEAVRLLSDAGEHIGELLVQQHSLDALEQASSLRKHATEHLTKLVDQLELALLGKKYVQVFGRAKVVEAYLDGIRSVLAIPTSSSNHTLSRLSKDKGDSHQLAHAALLGSHTSDLSLALSPPPPSSAHSQGLDPRPSPAARGQDIEERAQHALNDARRCMDDVDDEVALFTEHLGRREFGQTAFDTAKLITMLSKLQAGAEVAGSVDLANQTLQHRYRQATQTLSSDIKEALQHARQQAQTEQLFSSAIKIWTSMRREMAKGLEDHVSLPLDFDAELAWMRQEEERAGDAMKASCVSIELVTSHVQPVLRDLKAKAGGWLGFWRRKEYEQQKRIFIGEVKNMLHHMEDAVLKQNNYVLAGETAMVLRHIFHSPALTEHLESDAIQQMWSRTKDLVTEHYRGMCKKLQDALDLGDIATFEAVLRQVHEFEVGLSGVLSAELKPDAQKVHEAIHEWVTKHVQVLSTQLQKWEFGNAFESVKLLRSAGKVLVSTLALYMDMAELADRHSTHEQCLDLLRRECAQHFGFEAARAIGVHYAILELEPSSTERDVVKAYESASMKRHSDTKGSSAMQQRALAAREALMQDSNRARYQELVKAPFGKRIEQVPNEMLQQVQSLLQEGMYEQLAKKLRHVGALVNLMSLVDVCESEVRGYTKHIQDTVEDHMKSMRVKVTQLWHKRDFKQLNEQLGVNERADSALSSYAEIYSSEWSRKMQEQVEEEIERIAAKARLYLVGKTEEQAEATVRDFALQLIFLGRILDDLPSFRDFCHQKLAGLLDLCYERSWGYTFLFKLGMLLGQGKVGDLDKEGKVVAEDDLIGKTIVSDFKHFKDVTTMVWNEEVTQKDVRTIANDAKAWKVRGRLKTEVPLDTETLEKGFAEYEEEYTRCFDSWAAGRLQVEELADRAIAAAAAVRPDSEQDWSPELVSALPRLVAQVFCFFTVNKSGESYTRLMEHKDKTDGDTTIKVDNVLLKPHCTQVLTVLQLLGYTGGRDSTGSQLLSQLMQVRTGEGKSVVLGASAVVLALLGFHVRCACYSEYLSQRDYALFEDLFEGFGVLHLVTYSTITAYSEDMVRRQGDIRQLTANLLRGGSAVNSRRDEAPQYAANTSDFKEILLVDEVDVFFGKGFYGQTHNQVVQLDEPEVSELLHAVWRLHTSSRRAHTSGHLLRDVKQTQEYANVHQRFAAWTEIIDREVAAMCADVQRFDDPKPHYDRGLDKLGYKVMDGVDYDSVVYGYRTAFAHLNAVDTNTFRNPDAALKRALRLQVPSGKFSYANIQPRCILGVSGTLEALSDYELQVMERYGIELYASMPSVYGDTRLVFDHAGDGITIECSEEDFFRTITDEVNRKTRAGRAVIVYFEPARLEAYRASPYLKKVLHANVLDEGLDTKTRDHVIRKAATSGQATFSSAVFGRGTDFFCKDNKLTESGGVHVLQTFFSRQKAEEVQVQGRTARQGKQGTFGMVLLQGDLEEHFALGPHAFDDVAHGNWYSTLEQARATVHAKACSEIESDLAEATRVDALTRQYFDAALLGLQGHQGAATQFLDLYRELRPKEASVYHIVFVVDFSGSMRANDVEPSPWFASMGYDNRLGCALEACDKFVRKRFEAGAADVITFIAFASSAATAMLAEPLHENMIRSASMPEDEVGGGTEFDEAFALAARVVQQDSSSHPVLIMFLTDGRSDFDRHASEFRSLHENSLVSIKVIGFGSDCDWSTLEMIAARFGERGQCIWAVDDVELAGSFEAAAAELSHIGRK